LFFSQARYEISPRVYEVTTNL